MQLQPALSDLVSPFAATDEEDTKETKRALHAIGRYDPPEWGISGIPDDRMFEGLKALQKDAGLRTDREMKPGGPTHLVLNAELDRKKHAKDAPGLSIDGDVGERSANRPEDVRKVRSGLAHLDYLPKPEAATPKADFDATAAAALGGFQQDFNLKHDRFAGVRGPTIAALGRATGPQRRAESLARAAKASARAGTAIREQAAAPENQTQTPATPKPAAHKRLPIFDQFKPRDAFEEDRYAQLEKLGDLLHQDQPINEPDEMLGVTVLEAFGPDRLPGMRPLTAGKLFRLAHFADRDENVHDVWEAVADPEFPVRRGRFDLSNGDLIELNQDEANGDSQPDLRMAKVDTDRMYQRPYNGGDLLTGGLMMGGPRGVRSRTGVNIPSNSPSEEHVEDKKADNSEDSPERDDHDSTVQPVEDRVKSIPVEEDADEDSAETMVSNVKGIRHQESQDAVLEEVTDGTAEFETDKDAKEDLVSINTHKPKEAADEFIEKIARLNGTRVREIGGGRRVVEGKDGTGYTVYPERDSNKGRGVDIVVTLPQKGRSPKKATSS